MARVLIFTDRRSDDLQWKGALIWQIILSLAESQHEVQVVTPPSVGEIPFTHPRMTVVQPIKSWRLDQLPGLARVWLGFQPEVVHTFALEPSRRWTALSVWPALQALCKVSPRIRRVSSFFDENDCDVHDVAFDWHRTADVVTAFSDRHRARLEPRLGRSLQVVPLEVRLHDSTLERRDSGSTPNHVLIPAPISEWIYPEAGLNMLKTFCVAQPQCEVHILGGWGDWTSAAKKSGWSQLGSVAGRIHLHDDLTWTHFTEEMQRADTLWLEPLAQDSWRYLLSTLMARSEGQRLYLPSEWTPALSAGSTANSLSRLYSPFGG